MTRPAIGITAALESAAWTVWEDVEANLSPRTYSDAVAADDAIPLVLPPNDAATEAPEDVLDLLSGLILAGGADLEPATYGARPGPHTSGWRAERDRFELALARAALARDLPLLGVCRGMQVLNVACGGTIDQHLADVELHLHTPGRYSDHDIRLERGSLAARALGAERIAVRSHHHQGIERLGSGLIATGWAEPGGAIEAIEHPDRRFALGVLWHTEEDRRSRLIAGLVEAAREVVAA